MHFSAQHVVVMRKGLYYKLNVYDSEGNPLSPRSLEKQLDWILEDADRNIGVYAPGGFLGVCLPTGIQKNIFPLFGKMVEF